MKQRVTSSFVLALVIGLMTATAGAQQRPAGTPPEDLAGGEFVWQPEASPAGPVVVLVSLNEQFTYVYRNGVLIGYCPVATGKPGHETPTGVFTILQKDKDHVSSIYNAKMPYTERLTWTGICLHAGSIPGYPNSHGCVHLPLEFSRLLFEVEELGATVVIADEHSGPAEAAHPATLLSPMLHESSDGPSPDGRHFVWQPDRSPEGPVSLLLSTADRKLYVYRNGIEIGFGEIELTSNADPPHEAVYMLLPLEPGGYRWVMVTSGSIATSPAESMARIRGVRFNPGFAASIQEVLVPGATLVVTHAAATPETRSDADFVVMATQHPEAAEASR